ncbi:L-threonylcarbamoyladenylate synthase [Dongia deserti]|uniref:L-threonylcarbamoyladenylate synthase n=1 Tax=Dongia deserti TaxID=2268030 RepID=UPI000E655B4E|nr:L-threonylcarbamoyladenylate synthase [Dongia deserti]
MARRLQPTLTEIGDAARALRQGKLVAFPTETVYGLGGDATSDRAVAAIFSAKGRPSFNPLIVHVASATDAVQFAEVSANAQAVARSFWPGPLTMVLPRRRDCRISLLATAGLDSVAIRVPAHTIAQTLLTMTGLPLAAPSANPSGRLSPTSADHVLADLGDNVEFVIDGGACTVGVESTVLSLLDDKPRILRPGGVPAEAIAEVLQEPVTIETGAEDSAAPRSPGRLLSHYAPSLPVRLNAAAAEPGEILLGFGPSAPKDALNLSPIGDLQEAAANLFALLRRLDDPQYCAIAVMPVPETGLGIAINDRLRRAAAAR